MSPKKLDPSRLSDAARVLQEKLSGQIIGQERALREVVRAWSLLESGLTPKNKPLLREMMARRPVPPPQPEPQCCDWMNVGC